MDVRAAPIRVSKRMRERVEPPADGVHRRRATWITRQEREVIIAIQDFSGSFQPILNKSSLNVESSVPLNPKHGVTPAGMATLGKAPPIRKSCSADEGGRTVHHNHLAMGAIIGTKPIVPARGVLDTSSGLSQRFEIALGSGEAAECVHHQATFHSGASAFCQNFKQPSRDLPSVKNVGFDIDAALR